MSSDSDDKPTLQHDKELVDLEPDTRQETATGEVGLPAGTGSWGQLVTPDFSERYRFEQELGRGGMGVVYEYVDQRLGRPVAAKVARRKEDRANRADQEAYTAQFVHEARVQARLQHPSVVPVYDLGREQDGRVYFTMQRVQGMTLLQVIRGLRRNDATALERFGQRRLLTAFSQLCLAIDYAHAKGVLHRDLKPANLMLGEFGEVFVLDWGVASAYEGGSERDTPGGSHVGVSGGGTAGYMAPEQIAGIAVEQLTPAADVYALGAILYELLTWRPLNAGATPEERAASTLTGDQPPASVIAPEQDIAPELDVICMRATTADPARRFPSARSMHDAVEDYLDGVRDTALRNELAGRHALAAQEGARKLMLGRGSIEERRAVLKDVGKALALDPGHPGATATMIQLLTMPPRELPREVEKSIQKRRADQREKNGRFAAVAYASLLLYWPLFAWAGVRDLTALVAYSVMALGTAGFTAWVVARRKASEDWVGGAMILSTLTLATTAMLFGPLILVPALVATNAIAYVMTLGRRWRGRTIGVACGVLGGLLLLDLTGVIGPFYRFESSGLLIRSGAVELGDPKATMALLFVGAIGSVLTGGIAAWNLRESLEKAEKRLQVYSWHFRQLVPEHASPSVAYDTTVGPGAVPPLLVPFADDDAVSDAWNDP